MRPGHQHGCLAATTEINYPAISPFPGKDFTVLVSELHLTRPDGKIEAVFKGGVIQLPW